MSQENVELVVQLQPDPGVDIAALFRDDELWATAADASAPFFHPGCESVAPGLPGTQTVYLGVDGLRAAWLEWLEPWDTYRTEIKDALDAGERVLVLTNDYGIQRGASEEVKLDGSALWTVRDGKIARAEFFALRSEALKAAGLQA